MDQIKLVNSRKIILNEAVLFSNYTEDLFFKREEEERLVSILKPIAEKKRCENIFVYGSSGVGKTPLIKYALDEIRKISHSVLCIYINCWHYSTSMAIYVKIADALGEPVSRRGRATDEVFDRILERMRIDNMAVLLVLDDIDGLISKDDTKILHNIARVANNCARFGVIGISEDKNILNKIDSKILDSLRFVNIEIKGYSKEQLFEILKIRARKGLEDESYTDAVLEKIAEIGAENKGNGRLVLELLRKSAKKAERENKDMISLDDVNEASNWMNSCHIALSKEEQAIIDILKLTDKLASEIYWLFCKKLIRSKRQIRNYLVSLEKKGIIEYKAIQGRNRFGQRLVKLREGWLHG